MTRKKIALVIGWGSVKCAAALGLLRVLNREGIKIDMVVGSGGGSIYAALIALGYSAEEIVEMNRQLWTHEITEIPNRGALLQILLPKFFRIRDYFNLRDDRLINQRIQTAMAGRRFDETKIPLYITATEYTTGQQVILKEGDIAEAVRASVALPLIFPPVTRGGKLLADGFLSDPMPIGAAIMYQADIILAMGFRSESDGKFQSFPDYLLHLAGIMADNLLDASFAFYNAAHYSSVITVVPEFGHQIRLFDTQMVPEIIRVGEEEGARILPSLKLLLGEDA
jgi:NTE family protein